MLPAAALLRVSTPAQAQEGTSLDTQAEQVRAYALANDLELVEVIADDFTGRTRDRPGLQRLRELVAARAIAAVVLVKIDRIARKAHLGIALEQWLMAEGVRVIYTDQPLDLSTPAGRFMGTVFHGAAEFESDSIRRRTMDGRARKAREHGAMPSGHAPFGYRQVTRAEAEVLQELAGRSGQLIIHEPEAIVVRELFARAAAGESTRSLARWLTEAGVPTRRGGPWLPSTLGKLLRNEVYAGRRAYGRHTCRAQEELTDGGRPRVKRTARPREEWEVLPAPAIVDERTWQAVQARMRENRERFPGPNSLRWPLRGIVECATCRTQSGRPRAFVGDACQRKTTLYRYYRCGSKEGGCGVRVRADRLEAMAWRALEKAAVPGYLAALLRAEAEREQQRRGEPAQALEAARALLAEAEREEEELFAEARRGRFSEGLIARELEKVKGKRRRGQAAEASALARMGGPTSPAAVERAAEAAAGRLAERLPGARGDAAAFQVLCRAYLRITVGGARPAVGYRLPG